MINKILNIINYIEKLSINEGVEYVTKGDETYYFRNPDLDTYAFIIVGNSVILSQKNKTHGDAVIDTFKLKKGGFIDYENYEKIYKSIYYSGRIWINFKLISFWNSYVPETIIQDVHKKIKSIFPNENLEEYNIEYGRK